MLGNKLRKRGISPLIATVLIIGMVIALGTMVFIWTQRLTSETIEETSQTLEKSLRCFPDIKISIIDVCETVKNVTTDLNGSGIFDDPIEITAYNIVLENEKKTDLSEEIFLVRFEGKETAEVVEAGSASLVPSPVNQNLQPFERKTFLISKPENIDNVEGIVIIPGIRIDQKTTFCNEATSSYSKEIQPC